MFTKIKQEQKNFIQNKNLDSGPQRFTLKDRKQKRQTGQYLSTLKTTLEFKKLIPIKVKTFISNTLSHVTAYKTTLNLPYEKKPINYNNLLLKPKIAPKRQRLSTL